MTDKVHPFKMQFIDIKAIHQKSSSQIDAAVAIIFDHGRYIDGPQVYELEATLGEFLGRTKPLDCVAVASGTMALEVALRALGIGSGDEVITTPFTWISTAETTALVGAKPVFADIETDTYNIDPRKVEKRITAKTKAIIAVNLFGQMADYRARKGLSDESSVVQSLPPLNKVKLQKPSMAISVAASPHKLQYRQRSTD